MASYCYVSDPVAANVDHNSDFLNMVKCMVRSQEARFERRQEPGRMWVMPKSIPVPRSALRFLPPRVRMPLNPLRDPRLFSRLLYLRKPRRLKNVA